jgi:hypothetical protein
MAAIMMSMALRMPVNPLPDEAHDPANDTGGGRAAVQIALLMANPTLKAAEFV